MQDKRIDLRGYYARTRLFYISHLILENLDYFGRFSPDHIQSWRSDIGTRRFHAHRLSKGCDLSSLAALYNYSLVGDACLGIIERLQEMTQAEAQWPGDRVVRKLPEFQMPEFQKLINYIIISHVYSFELQNHPWGVALYLTAFEDGENQSNPLAWNHFAHRYLGELLQRLSAPRTKGRSKSGLPGFLCPTACLVCGDSLPQSYKGACCPGKRQEEKNWFGKVCDSHWKTTIRENLRSAIRVEDFACSPEEKTEAIFAAYCDLAHLIVRPECEYRTCFQVDWSDEALGPYKDWYREALLGSPIPEGLPCLDWNALEEKEGIDIQCVFIDLHAYKPNCSVLQINMLGPYYRSPLSTDT